MSMRFFLSILLTPQVFANEDTDFRRRNAAQRARNCDWDCYLKTNAFDLLPAATEAVDLGHSPSMAAWAEDHYIKYGDNEKRNCQCPASTKLQGITQDAEGKSIAVSARIYKGKTYELNDLDKFFKIDSDDDILLTGLAAPRQSDYYQDREFTFYYSKVEMDTPMKLNKGAWSHRTKLDGEFTFQCPANQAISSIMSDHSNHHEDRNFAFRCADISSGGTYAIISTRWTDWLNSEHDMDEEFDGQCHGNEVLVGLESYHSGWHEDRRWKLKCGKLQVDDSKDCTTIRILDVKNKKVSTKPMPQAIYGQTYNQDNCNKRIAKPRPQPSIATEDEVSATETLTFGKSMKNAFGIKFGSELNFEIKSKSTVGGEVAGTSTSKEFTFGQKFSEEKSYNFEMSTDEQEATMTGTKKVVRSTTDYHFEDTPPYTWFTYELTYTETEMDVEVEFQMQCVQRDGQVREQWVGGNWITQTMSHSTWKLEEKTAQCPGYNQCKCIGAISDFVTGDECSMHPFFTKAKGCYVPRAANCPQNEPSLGTAKPPSNWGAVQAIFADYPLDAHTLEWSYAPCDADAQSRYYFNSAGVGSGRCEEGIGHQIRNAEKCEEVIKTLGFAIVTTTTVDAWPKVCGCSYNRETGHMQFNAFNHVHYCYESAQHVGAQDYDSSQNGLVAVCVTPTAAPTAMPTRAPTAMPTRAPTAMPTRAPTAMPTRGPTAMPTAAPIETKAPTAMPTAGPIETNTPTVMPTAAPIETKVPTAMPIAAPIETKIPTVMPTAAPIETNIPTVMPTAAPIETKIPTVMPTAAPIESTPVNPCTRFRKKKQCKTSKAKKMGCVWKRNTCDLPLSDECARFEKKKLCVKKGKAMGCAWKRSKCSYSGVKPADKCARFRKMAGCIKQGRSKGCVWNGQCQSRD